MSRARKNRDIEEGDDEFDMMEGAGAGAGALPAGAIKSSTLSQLMRGVVKIFAHHAKPNFAQPWQMKQPVKSTSSGFIIAGHMIITNAHSVAYSTLVQVRKQGHSEKVTARVLATAHDCDLAVLTVDDPSFWKGAPALEFGELPNLHDNVMVVGYPLGGEQISVTAGVVSRIDYGMYSHSTRDHLVLQTDSAINSGNSGGPCFDVQTSKVVGVAFQSLSDAENVGYVVPVDILKHVLEDYRRTGKYNGFGRIGFLYQNLENKHLKSYFGLPAGAGGILISRVSPVSPLNGVVREKDVLIALDDQPIADDGTVAFPGRSEERISFGYLLTYKFIGDSVKLSLIREGKPLTVSVPVTDVPDLVPHSLHDRKPSYIVHAGLVMTALTEPYLASMYGKEWDARGPVRLVHYVYHGLLDTPGQQVVILSSVLSNSCVVGYDEAELQGLPLVSVQGKKITNLLDVARAIRDCTEPVLRLEFADSKLVVLPTDLAKKATDEVLKTHAIGSVMSDDLAEALAAEAAGGSASSSNSNNSSGSSSSSSSSATGESAVAGAGGKGKKRQAASSSSGSNSSSSGASAASASAAESRSSSDAAAAAVPAVGSKRKAGAAAASNTAAKKAGASSSSRSEEETERPSQKTKS